MNQFLQATELAHSRYQTMLGPRYGVRWIRNYFLSRHEITDDDVSRAILPLTPETRLLRESEHPFSGYPVVLQYDTLLIEPSIYLNAMLTDFRVAGGAIRVVHFDHASELQQLAEPVIFNCTGLGALALFDDRELGPVYNGRPVRDEGTDPTGRVLK